MKSYGLESSKSLLQKTYTVKIGAYLGSGWALFKKNAVGFIGFTIVLILMVSVPDCILFSPSIGKYGADAASFSILSLLILTLIFVFVFLPLSTGFFIVALKLLRHRATTFGDFFRGFNNYLSLFFVNLVPITFIIIGIQLFILPGTYLAVAYLFAVPLVLDKKMDFWNAMELSRKLISKNWFAFFAFFVVLVLINLISPLLIGIAFLFLMFSALGGVGNTSAAIPILVLTLGAMFLGLVVLLVTIPFSFCAIAAAYADIVGLPSATSESDV